MSSREEDINFEKAVRRLEEIVRKLEEGQVPLDESLKLFEEGVKLSRFCSGKLEEIERKIEILTKGENGELHTEPFQEDNPDESF